MEKDILFHWGLVPIHTGSDHPEPISLYLKTNRYGRGVYAAGPIEKGRTIVVEPVLVVPNKDLNGIVSIYAYDWGRGKAGLVLGFGSLFNHSYQPNARYLLDTKRSLMKFVALRDIDEDEEIFINYNYDPEDKTPVWFKVR